MRLESPAAVRSRIATLTLADGTGPVTLGSVSLHEHQLSAVARLQVSIAEFNGALLCDEVGMGKTYVAIAVARRYQRRLVVAPAALAAMWHVSLATTRTTAELLTFESLSRIDSRPAHGQYDIVIVDEAHHARNPGTNRYFALASLARGARVLLLSATPIHNQRSDLIALLSLFLGSRARAMTTAELSLCIVRRGHTRVARSAGIPAVAPVVHHQVNDDGRIVAGLLRLPPPIPVRDGGLGGTLIGRGLVHQWASSEAALHEAVARRIARAMALCASLEAGSYPTARDLETWTYGEGSLQLGFAELLSSPAEALLAGSADLANGALLDTVRSHLRALQEFRAMFNVHGALDDYRAAVVDSIRRACPDAKIVAFAQYAQTISALFRRLTSTGRIAMLTSHGARVAGGVLTRADAIRRFAPVANHSDPPHPAEVIDLLLTTDILSEGVNLQDASIVIHLDVPWTVARMEQRVGRVARIGSRHARIAVHVVRPPRSASDLLETELIVQRKWTVAKAAVGASAPSPMSTGGNAELETDPIAESTPEKIERLRTILQSWIVEPIADAVASEGKKANGDHVVNNEGLIVASVSAPRDGYIAATSASSGSHLVVSAGNDASTDLNVQIEACQIAGGVEVLTDVAEVERAQHALRTWFASEQASSAAGVGVSSAVRRRLLTTRIDAIIRDAPPHLRPERSIVGARARRVATSQQCAAAEAELRALLHSDLPPDDWLRAVAAVDSNEIPSSSVASSTADLTIHALLLLRARSA
ncbi:MAG: SNF2-related protein [Gemmatimonadaceae bacterium]